MMKYRVFMKYLDKLLGPIPHIKIKKKKTHNQI